MRSIFFKFIYIFFYFLTFFIQLRLHVLKFHFIRVLLQKIFCNNIIDIQRNAEVSSTIISQKVNTKI